MKVSMKVKRKHRFDITSKRIKTSFLFMFFELVEFQLTYHESLLLVYDGFYDE